MSATSDSCDINWLRTSGGDARTAESFTVFAFIWGVTEGLHLVTFGAWVDKPVGIALAASVFWLLLRPSSLGRFALVNGLDFAYIFTIAPMTANHILFNAFVNLAMLLIIAMHWLRRRDSAPIDRAAVFEQIRVFGRLALIMLYFFAVFHKLNTDYFKPQISCASHLLVTMDWLPFTLDAKAVLAIAIWSTLIVEALIPAMLVIGPLRKYGLGLELGFHLFLSTHMHTGLYSFSALMFAMYFLFLPDVFVARLKEKLVNRRAPLSAITSVTSGYRRYGRRATLAAAACVIVFVIGVMLTGVDIRVWKQYVSKIGLGVWIVWGCALACTYVWTDWGKSAPMREWGVRRVLLPGPDPAMIILVLMFAHSMSPYFGLKTVPVLSMFSNLRTEGGVTNHLIMPQWLKVAGYQQDLVDIRRASHGKLRFCAKRNLLLPYFEFRRVVTQIDGPVRVKYVRDGREHVYKRTESGRVEGKPIEPVPWLLGKYLRFRAVDKDPPTHCRW